MGYVIEGGAGKPTTITRQPTYVPYDKNLADLGLIVPTFVTEEVYPPEVMGYRNLDEVLALGLDPSDCIEVTTYGDREPRYLLPLVAKWIETKQVLKWREVDLDAPLDLLPELPHFPYLVRDPDWVYAIFAVVLAVIVAVLVL